MPEDSNSIDNVKIEPSPSLGNAQKQTTSQAEPEPEIARSEKRTLKRTRKFRLSKPEQQQQQQPKAKRMKVSRKLHDHSVKEWPYQGPVSNTKTQPDLNKVKKKPKLKGPHKETLATKLLKNVGFEAQFGFVDVNVFNELYTSIILSPNQLLGKCFHEKKIRCVEIVV